MAISGSGINTYTALPVYACTNRRHVLFTAILFYRAKLYHSAVEVEVETNIDLVKERCCIISRLWPRMPKD